MKVRVDRLHSSSKTGAARIAATLGVDGPDGVVLTSTVTRNGREFPYSAANADVRRITAPVLFVHNRNDSCIASPPGAIAPLIARFAPWADVTRIDVASAPTDNDPCGPFASHGYLGIETDVVTKIVAWMHAHGAPEAPH